jgi:hypothetical protein
MHEYDTVLKAFLQSPEIIFERITGTRVSQWLNVEFPEVQQTRADMRHLSRGSTSCRRRTVERQ